MRTLRDRRVSARGARSVVLAVALVACRRESTPLTSTVRADALRVRVRVVHPTTAALHGATSLPGTLRPWRRAVLSSRLAGDVLAINVDRGDRVAAGAPLGALRVPGLSQQVAVAVASEEVAQAMLLEQADVADRMKSVAMASSAAVSSLEVSAARAKAVTAQAKAQAAKAEVTKASSMLGDARFVAPFEGVVVARMVDSGTSVASGDKLVEIADVSALRLVVDVPESDLRLVRASAPVVVDVPASGIDRLEAKVARFSPSLEMATRTLRLEIDLPNGDGRLFAGSEARVRFVDRLGSVLTIPDDALVVSPTGTFAFVASAGKAKRVPVQLGADDGASVEVRTGLSPDDEVIVGGGGLLDDGALVEVAR